MPKARSYASPGCSDVSPRTSRNPGDELGYDQKPPTGNAVIFLLRKNGGSVVAGVARLQTRGRGPPNSCESGYISASQRCQRGGANNVANTDLTPPRTT